MVHTCQVLRGTENFCFKKGKSCLSCSLICVIMCTFTTAKHDRDLFFVTMDLCLFTIGLVSQLNHA